MKVFQSASRTGLLLLLSLCGLRGMPGQASGSQGNALQPAATGAQSGAGGTPSQPPSPGPGPAPRRARRGAGNPSSPSQAAGSSTAAGAASTAPGSSAAGASTPASDAAATQNPPASVSTEKIYTEGQGDHGRHASDDKPLLPIAQQSDALGIRSGTPIRVRLKQAVDSSHARNGDVLNAMLAEPVGGLPAGTPVQLTVVLSLRAGTINSYGELSIQVVSIAEHRVLSEIVTALGKEGKKELADAAPSLGTDAGFTADQVITLNAS